MMNILKSSKTYHMLLFVLILLSARASFSQTHMELIPTLNIREEYDDNIFLRNQNEESDYLTRVSPKFDFNLLSQHTQLALAYAPELVWYARKSEDIARHKGMLSFDRQISEHFNFKFDDTYLYSDDPLEREGIETIRKTRDTYQRNSLETSIKYLFRSKDALVAGYKDMRLDNENDAEDDGTIIKPYATISYHLNIRNWMEFEYGYTEARFWRGDDRQSIKDNYYGHAPGLSYNYLFTPHTTGSLGYTLTTRNFSDEREDYRVHAVLAVFSHAFSPEYRISAGAGYFTQEKEVSSGDSGIVYNLSFKKTFERGDITIGGNGGWGEDTLTSTNRGFSKDWSLNASTNYQLLKTLKGYASGYFTSSESGDITYDKIIGRCGLIWVFLPDFSLILNYTYANRNDDIESDSYTANRISLSLRYRTRYRW